MFKLIDDLEFPESSDNFSVKKDICIIILMFGQMRTRLRLLCLKMYFRNLSVRNSGRASFKYH